MSEFSSSASPNTDQTILMANTIFFLDEEMSDWKVVQEARARERITATRIVPLSSRLDGSRHDVAWIRRQGTDPQTGEPYDFHHAACRCIMQTEGLNDFVSMASCEVWQLGRAMRAWELAEEAQTLTDMIGEAAMLQDRLGLSGFDPASQVILDYMARDTQNPGYWAGNSINGLFDFSTLSALTGLDYEKLAAIAGQLQDQGWVKFVGEYTLTLN